MPYEEVGAKFKPKLPESYTVDYSVPIIIQKLQLVPTSDKPIDDHNCINTVSHLLTHRTPKVLRLASSELCGSYSAKRHPLVIYAAQSAPLKPDINIELSFTVIQFNPLIPPFLGLIGKKTIWDLKKGPAVYKKEGSKASIGRDDCTYFFSVLYYTLSATKIIMFLFQMSEAKDDGYAWMDYAVSREESDCETDGMSSSAYHSRKLTSVPPKTIAGLYPLDCNAANNYHMVKKNIDRARYVHHRLLFSLFSVF